MNNPAHNIREFWNCFKLVTQDCNSVVEFGCGHGDNLRRTDCEAKTGVEIVSEYTTMRPADGITFIIGDAIKVAKSLASKSYDLVMLIDVVEHFYNPDGSQLILQSQRIAKKRVLIWMPEGFLRQDKEVYSGTNSEYVYKPSQDHLGSWMKDDLEGMGFDTARWDNYHPDRVDGHLTPALFGIWNRPELAPPSV